MNYFKLFFFSLIVFVFNNNAFSADAVKGEKLFTKCKACHNADAPKHKVGPHLVGIVGRKAGAAEGYTKYSKDLKDSGIVWDEANLDKWLTGPKAMYPKTKMIYPGLKKAEDRADIIEYLKTK
jgi:cytochrome c